MKISIVAVLQVVFLLWMQITHSVGTDKPPYHYRQIFVLLVGNSLDGLFHLWHIKSDFRFSKKQSEMWTRQTREYVSTVFGPSQITPGPETGLRNSVSVQNFKLHFLMHRFSKVLLSPCGYVHHGSMTVSQPIKGARRSRTFSSCFPSFAFTHRDFP